METINEETLKLFTTLVGSRPTAECALAYLAKCNQVPTPENIMGALGVTKSVAEKVAAAAKLSFHFVLGSNPVYLGNPDLIAAFLCDLKDAHVEHYVMVTLDAGNHLIKRHECGIGSSSEVTASKRDLLARALADHASKIIVAHNHPGGVGTLEFSKEDIAGIRNLYKIASSMGIRLLDCLVITSTGVKSLYKEQPNIFGSRKKA